MALSQQKWTVAVTDFFPGLDGRRCRAVALVEGVSRRRARKLERRHAARGVKLFGGAVVAHGAWGLTAGRELRAYRSVFIRLTQVERPHG